MPMPRYEKFLDFIKTRNLIDDARLRRAVRQYGAFDRRMGFLSSFLGYIKPEQINEILQEQTRSGLSFRDCASQLNIMSEQQLDRVANLQRDDLSIFAQSVVIQNAATSVEFTSFLREFITVYPDAAHAVDPHAAASPKWADGRIDAVLKNVDQVSPLPNTVQRVVALLDNPEVNLDEIADILKMDPGLTSTLLRVSNSAFYGLRSKIGSVKKALQVLGTDKLRQLVIVAGIMQKSQGVSADFAVKFWENAVRTAECSKEIGKYCRIAELDELFVCGLLHNIGEIVLKQFMPDNWNKIQELIPSRKNSREAEREILGATHADIGGFMLHLWRLPKATVLSSMFHHHDYNLLIHTQNIPDEVYVVHMASAICNLNRGLDGFAYSRALELISERYRGRLKYPEMLDLNNLTAKVDAIVNQLDQTYFK